MLRKIWIGSATLLLFACAAPIRQAAISANTTDALLPSGHNLFLFDFAQSRYQKWPLGQDQGPDLDGGAGVNTSAAGGSHEGLCRVVDTLKGDWSAPVHWLALPSPAQPFAPMKAIWGPSGNFFLLDRAGKRLCLYDSAAQFLSGFPLPQEIRDRNLERFQVFWTRDGVFSFLDPSEAKVWQYAELRSIGGSGDWKLRNTINLPLGMDECIWEPFSRSPCCLRGRTTNVTGNSKAVCFDKYFNVTGGWNPAPAVNGMSIEPLPGESSWRVVLDPGPSCGPASRFCFSPDKGGFAPCPVTAAPIGSPASDSTRPEPGLIPREP